MTTPPGGVPEWDLPDRMRKALRVARLSVQEMAVYLDVTRNTVGNWINGRIEPSTQTLRLWALRTGVAFEWLQSGMAPAPGSGPDGDPRSPDSRPGFGGTAWFPAPVEVLPTARNRSDAERVELLDPAV